MVLRVWLIYSVSAHFLWQISIFRSPFWFFNILVYKIGFRNLECVTSNFSVLIRDIKIDLTYSFSTICHLNRTYLPKL